MKKELLTKKLHIRLSELENRALIQLAKSHGEKTRSSIIRKIVRHASGQGPELLKDDLSAFRENVRELAVLGSEVNQIAHAVNSGQTSGLAVDPYLIQAVANQVAALEIEFKKIVMRSRNRWLPHA